MDAVSVVLDGDDLALGIRGQERVHLLTSEFVGDGDGLYLFWIALVPFARAVDRTEMQLRSILQCYVHLVDRLDDDAVERTVGPGVAGLIERTDQREDQCCSQDYGDCLLAHVLDLLTAEE